MEKRGEMREGLLPRLVEQEHTTDDRHRCGSALHCAVITANSCCQSVPLTVQDIVISSFSVQCTVCVILTCLCCAKAVSTYSGIF